jgi:uncharacterized membrane protein YfcA
MITETALLLALLIFVMATLYSSVGHAGASGYLAAMALLSVAPELMRPTALVLNIFVATIATIQFAWAGHFSWRLYWPFVATAVPAAYLGGALALPARWYAIVVGGALLLAALRMFFTAVRAGSEPTHPPPLWAALLTGACIGMLAGLTGTGGGIFLTPIVLFMRWADAKKAAGLSAPFILATSIAGIVGLLSKSPALPGELPIWITAAVAGGLTGAYFGSRRLSSPWLRRLLALVLAIAGLKMLLT